MATGEYTLRILPLVRRRKSNSYLSVAFAGIGNGVVAFQSIVMVNLYFKKYRGLASGVALAGGGLGLLVVPLLERKFISHFSWQPSFYIVAGICLNTCVAGALMRPVKFLKTLVDIKKEEDNIDVFERKSLYQNKPFIFVCVSSLIWGLAATVPLIVGPDFYKDCGMNGFQINILLSSVGGGNLVGRLVGGIVCNIQSLNKLLFYAITTTLVGVNIGLFTITTEFAYLVVLASSFGFMFGAFIVAHTVVSATVVEESKIELSITASYFISGIALIMGPPLAGGLFDLTNSYQWPFLVSAITMIAAAFSILPGIWWKRLSTTMALYIEAENTNPDEKLNGSLTLPLDS